jgi:Raf kinase inhibitor-like YbhB/YbcL family protein
MRLTSSAFRDGDDIPKRYTCDGENVSPPLAWSGAPAATKSFALLCDDPDAPRGTWRHWGVYDLGPQANSLPEGAGKPGGGLKQAVNDFGHDSYGGPCPPHGHGVHHYHFRLLALSADGLNLRPGNGCRDVEEEAQPHILAEAALVGCYRR